MHWIPRILLLLFLGFVTYLFWPRTPELDRFRPEQMARLEYTVWEKQLTTQFFRRTLTYYRIFAGQYDFPPLSALHAAGQLSWTSVKCRHLEVDTEFEQLIVPVEEVYARLSDQLPHELEAPSIARAQVAIWRNGFSEPRKVRPVPYQRYLSRLYGISSKQAEPIAIQMAEARARFLEAQPHPSAEQQEAIESLLLDAYNSLAAALAEKSASAIERD